MEPALHIDQDAVYTEGQIALALDITLAAILTARRSGVLKYVRCGRRVIITGRSLREWLTPRITAGTSPPAEGARA